MLEISKEEVLKKWGAMPMNLKEALCSEYSAETVKQICELQHIPKEKILIVATNAGDVIFGFLHIEELAKEIQKDLGINAEIANTIVAEIDRKIFRPIKADIEKNYYSPIPEAEEKTTEPVETAKPESTSPFAVEAPSFIKQPAGQEIRRKEINDTNIQMGANDTNNTNKETAPIIPPTLPAPQQPQEGPIIIHKETEFKPIAGIKKSLGGLFGALNGKEKVEEKPVRAEIEFGKYDTNIQMDANDTNNTNKTTNEITPPIKVVELEKEVDLPTPPLPPQDEQNVIKDELNKILSAETVKSEEKIEIPKIKVEEIKKINDTNIQMGANDTNNTNLLEEIKSGFFKKTLNSLTSLFGKKEQLEEAQEKPTKIVDYNDTNDGQKTDQPAQ